MRCRKDHRDLTQAERDQFVQALYHVKATGIVDQFASDHDAHFSHAHNNPDFLPWHREFVRRFEAELRTYDPEISIPYWNSTEDNDPAGPLWSNSFLGQFDAAWDLDRSLGAGGALASPSEVQTALSQGTYAALRPFVEAGSNLHGSAHIWVGGDMGGSRSPADPVFYLHHCWIDLLFAQWQLLHPGAAFGATLNDPMHPWTTTPADVLDHRTINIYHYPAGMQPDLPAVTLDTPTVNFIEVPTGETRLQAIVFSLDACEAVHFNVTAGPTIITGPPATSFVMMSNTVAADPHVDDKGRLWVRFTGTAAGDVATGSVTIHCDETGEDFVVALAANTIARPTTAAVMVLDQSNSMNEEAGISPGVTRAQVLRFSAAPVIAVVDDVHALAVCSFDHDPHPGIGMTAVGSGGRVLINGAITSYAPNPNGWTSIGEAVAFAKGILDPVTGYDVKAMVVLSDGQEMHGPHTRRYISDVTDLINSMNGHVFAIGLGRAEVLNAGALEALCSGNNGYMVMTGDLTPDASFRLAKYYQQIFAGVTNNEIVLDPEGTLLPGQVHRIPFWLNEADINAKAILLSTMPYGLEFALETPDGDIINAAAAAAHPMASLDMTGQVQLYRVALPIPLGPNEAHAGRWHALLSISKRLSSVVTTHVPATGVPTGWTQGIPYSVNVHAYSNLRMKVTLSQSGNQPGATINLRAALTEYGIAATGPATCRAEMVRPDGTTGTLFLTQAGAGAFEISHTASHAGIYQFRIVAEGKTMRGRTFTREQTRTAAVWRGGDQPPPSSKDEPGQEHERFCRLVRCLLRQKSVQEKLRRCGIDIGELNRCLETCGRPHLNRLASVQPEILEQLKMLLRDPDAYERLMRDD